MSDKKLTVKNNHSKNENHSFKVSSQDLFNELLIWHSYFSYEQLKLLLNIDAGF